MQSCESVGPWYEVWSRRRASGFGTLAARRMLAQHVRERCNIHRAEACAERGQADPERTQPASLQTASGEGLGLAAGGR
jgi:hypothetical protein